MFLFCTSWCTLWPTLGWAVQSTSEVNAPSDYDQAKAYLSKKQWSQAADLLKVIANGTRGVPELALDLSKALFNLGNRAEAVQTLIQYASHERGAIATTLTSRARLMTKIFRSEDAYGFYQEGVNFLMEKRYPEAIEKFETAVKREPDNVEILLRLGQTMELAGDHNRALDRLAHAKKLSVQEPEVHLWYGRSLHKKGQLEDAHKELLISYKELPRSEFAPNWLSEVMLDRGDREKAIALLERDLSLEPMHLLTVTNLVKYRLGVPGTQVELLKKSKRELEKALERVDKYLSPDLAPFESELGLDLRDPHGMKGEIQTLQTRVDARLSQK